MRWLVLLGLVTLAACRPPARLAGEFPRTTIVDAQQGGHEGEQVRWGGVVVSTTPENDRTCLEILNLPLDRRARPRFVDANLGRFVACATGFYDPKVYAVDREVTVVGTLTAPRSGKVGEFDYLYPRVDATTIFLWPDRRRPPYYYEDRYPYAYYPYPYASYPFPYLYPYWYPYPYWGGGLYWGSGWGWDGWHDHRGYGWRPPYGGRPPGARPPGGRPPGGRPPGGGSGGGRPPGGGSGGGRGGGPRR